MSIAYLLCTVLAVSDGDTVRLTCTKHKPPFDLRINYIDAPELEHKNLRPPIALQAFGPQAAASLRALCVVGKPANVARTALADLHGRALGRIKCQGRDVAAYQVKAGMAWVYDAYTPKTSNLYLLQKEAKAAKVGVWSDPNSIAPWLWRKGVR